MVEAVRRGLSLREAAAKFGVSHVTVLRWTQRAAGARLSRVDWADRAAGTRGGGNRTPAATELQVIELRRELRERSLLGEYGAKAIHAELVARGLVRPPSLRTIGRILERAGTLDRARRVRRPAPPRGWYLPDLAQRRAEADSFDVVEDLKIQGGPLIDVLTGVSLHGGLPAAWPMESVPATAVVERLIEHWREVGLPDYAQFDNDRRFQGPTRWADSVGRVSRLCLGLGVAVVFAPPREHGLQADIERFNLLWQQKAWRRFHHTDLADLVARSARYIGALRARRAVRIEAAPARRPFPDAWRLDLQAHPRGRMVFVRRTDDQGEVGLFARRFVVDPAWVRRLVRCDVDLDAGVISFHALRRAAPETQPLLRRTPYVLPRRMFWQWRSHPPR